MQFFCLVFGRAILTFLGAVFFFCFGHDTKNILIVNRTFDEIDYHDKLFVFGARSVKIVPTETEQHLSKDHMKPKHKPHSPCRCVLRNLFFDTPCEKIQI